MPYVFQFGDLLAYSDLLLRGAAATLILTAAATLLGVALGIVGAGCRTSRSALARGIALGYVEFIRNTPFIVQLFFIFFGLPSLGVRLPAEAAAAIAMVVNLGAYSTEIIRAGIDAIHRGQVEAGLALGMTRFEIFRYIVIRPALAKVYPALSSQIVLVMLGSAVVSQIAAEELTFAAQYIQSRNFRSFETYLVTTGLYLVLAVGVRQTLRLAGRAAFGQRA
jgi:polar amino acid transport system permease protein